MVYIIAMEDSPVFWIIAAIVGAVIIWLCALDSDYRERNFNPTTPQEWSSGATPDDTDETQF